MSTLIEEALTASDCWDKPAQIIEPAVLTVEAVESESLKQSAHLTPGS